MCPDYRVETSGAVKRECRSAVVVNPLAELDDASHLARLGLTHPEHRLRWLSQFGRGIKPSHEKRIVTPNQFATHVITRRSV